MAHLRPQVIIDRLIYAVALPLLFPLVFLIGLGWMRHLPSEWRLLRSMKRSGRYLTPTSAADACAAGRGTAIWELANPHISRLWWAEDEVRQAPLEHDAFGPIPPEPDPEFDQWAYDRYLAPQGGRALLVRTGKLDVSVLWPESRFSRLGGRLVLVYTGRVRKTSETVGVT